MPDDRKAEFEEKQVGGNKALDVMNTHLKTREFFVNDRLSIADISLYAYTHLAEFGGFDLSRYPSVSQWLDRVSSHPLHIELASQTN